MDVQDVVRVAARVMQSHKLSDVMVGALMTGSDGVEIEAGPKQVRALVERGLVSDGYNTLTDHGRIVLHAMQTGEVAPENESLVFPVAAPSVSADQYFITDAGEIRPFSEAPEGAQSLSWGAAKVNVIADATARRRADAELIKRTRSLRKRDLTGADVEQPELFDGDESGVEDDVDTDVLV